MTLLDFIRYDKHLKGTKIGCREGDCTVLIGSLSEDKMNYLSMTSCITPLGNAIATKTPEEIAISIAAEIIRVSNQ